MYYLTIINNNFRQIKKNKYLNNYSIIIHKEIYVISCN